MASLGAEVHGIDVVERNLQVARAHAARSGRAVDYELATVEAVAERGVAYDAVLNMEVVEHVADLEGFLAASCRLVRPGGMMFVATINRTPLSWLIAIVGAEYVLRWMPKGTHRWDWFRKPGEVEALLRAHDVEPRDTTGVFVNPLRKSLHLVGSRQVNWMMSAVKPAPRDEAAAGGDGSGA
jgi:2-polyprenyl-6-hydroxyphenyl methylase/3-demethylubiquinone-9 3-methyltransferase